MKILAVIDSLERGGSEQSLVELLGALVASGVEPSLHVLREAPDGLEPDARGLGIQLRHSTSPSSRRRVLELRHTIKEQRPDVVHTSLYASDQLGRIAAWRTGVPVLTSLVNTLDAPSRRNDPALRPWRLRAVSAFDRFTARRLTAHFHAVSHAVARSAIATLRVPAERITVVERGRDPARLGTRTPERRARVRAELGIDARAEVVLAVGRQEHQKGHRHLLAAFEQITPAHPSAVLLIAGRSGSSSAQLEQQRAGFSIADRIQLLGARRDVPDLMAAADVFVLPSLYEGIPGSVIEAMALELPIVATDIDPVRELVDAGSSAIVVPVGDATAIAAAVTRLLDDAALARGMAARAHTAFSERFTLARSAGRMLELYERVAGAPQRRLGSPGTQVAT